MIKKPKLILLAVLLLALIPQARASGLAVERQVFTYLTQELGLNTAAACGVLANIEAESDFRLTNSGDAGSSFGLCQWHNSRFQKLRSYCLSRGLDYTTVAGQMSYLSYELQTDYQSTYQILRNVPNTSDGAYTAAYFWCIYYERPAAMEQSAVRRGLSAQMKYWTRYGGTAADGTDVSGNSYSGSLFSQQPAQSFYWENEDTDTAIPGTTLQRPSASVAPAKPSDSDSRQENTETQPQTSSPHIQYVPHHLPKANTPAPAGWSWSWLFVTPAPLPKKKEMAQPELAELPDVLPQDVELPWELMQEAAGEG